MEKQNEQRYKLNIQLFADKESEESINSEDFEDVEETSTETEEKKPTEKKGQSREENARQAEMRRERERKEREEKLKAEAFLKGQLDSIKTNTFTNQPITDKHDLDIFKIQCELKSQGKDPIDDLPSELARREREKYSQEEKMLQEKKEENQRINQDIQDFMAKNPDVNCVDLLKNPLFKKYASNRLGKTPLNDLFTEYNEVKKAIIDDYKAQEKAKAERKREKERGSSTSSSGSSPSIQTSYSKLSEAEKYKRLKDLGYVK